MSTNRLARITALAIPFALASTVAAARPSGTAPHLGAKLWSCDPWADPDFAVADIFAADDGSLVARVYQESGDGDEGGTELVPVTTAPAAGGSYVFVQAGAAQREDGTAGLTRGLRLELTVSRTEGRRIDADGVLLLDEGPTGQSAEDWNSVTCSSAD